MNFLAMYVVLACILSVATFVAWTAYGETKKKSVLVVAISISGVFLFCAAMAGLLS